VTRQNRAAAKPSPSIDKLLATAPLPVAVLAHGLRRSILGALPDLRETGYAGWRAIGFYHADAGYLGGIFLLEGYVKVYYEQGRLLPDPGGLLEGDLQQTRFIRIDPGAEIPIDAIIELFREAITLGEAMRPAKKARQLRWG
jgi:hypothetical protein